VRESEKADTYTLGGELGNLSEGRNRVWTVAREETIPHVADSIVAKFESVGLPYFAEFSDLERVLKVLSRDDPSSCIHSPFDDRRAKLAVAIALQLEGKESAQRLAKAKLAYLVQRSDPGLPWFRTFLQKVGLSETSDTVEKNAPM
jgi:hypothetical protein